MSYYPNFYVKSWGPQWPIIEFRTISVERQLETNQWSLVRGENPGPNCKEAFHVKAKGDPQWYLVDGSDIQWIVSPEAKSGAYKATTICMDKIVRNARWVQLCDNIGNRDGIVLDASEGVTTTMSLESGLFRKLIVPNFTPKFAEDFKVKDDRVRVYPGALYELLIGEDHVGKSYDFALDYCCTLYGSNHAVLPRVDLTLIFSRQLLRKRNGVLWLTFSMRGNSVDRTVADTISLIKELSDQHQYTTKGVDCGYYGQMVYFLFKT